MILKWAILLNLHLHFLYFGYFDANTFVLTTTLKSLMQVAT